MFVLTGSPGCRRLLEARATGDARIARRDEHRNAFGCGLREILVEPLATARPLSASHESEADAEDLRRHGIGVDHVIDRDIDAVDRVRLPADDELDRRRRARRVRALHVERRFGLVADLIGRIAAAGDARNRDRSSARGPGSVPVGGMIVVGVLAAAIRPATGTDRCRLVDARAADDRDRLSAPLMPWL